jgi:hypothetical protein
MSYRNKIKIIACITMLIDHFSKIFLESIMNDKLFPLYLAGECQQNSFMELMLFRRIFLMELGQSHFRYFAYCCRKVSFIPKIENGILEEC